MEGLEKNHSYLVKYGNSITIMSMTVLIVTEKAYFIRWNKGLDSYESWEIKQTISSSYTIIEDITSFMTDDFSTIKKEF